MQPWANAAKQTAVYTRCNVIMLIRRATDAVTRRCCVHYAMCPSLDGQLDDANLFTDDGPILLLARAQLNYCYQTRLGSARLGKLDPSDIGSWSAAVGAGRAIWSMRRLIRSKRGGQSVSPVHGRVVLSISASTSPGPMIYSTPSHHVSLSRRVSWAVWWDLIRNSSLHDNFTRARLSCDCFSVIAHVIIHQDIKLNKLQFSLGPHGLKMPLEISKTNLQYYFSINKRLIINKLIAVPKSTQRRWNECQLSGWVIIINGDGGCRR